MRSDRSLVALVLLFDTFNLSRSDLLFLFGPGFMLWLAEKQLSGFKVFLRRY